MADVTPPVGLASFAAAAIARTDPIKTGITAFFYSLRTAVLPFLFIFNTQLLMIGIDGIPHLMLTIVSAITGMLVFAAATQGYFLVRTRWYEALGLFLITFTLFRPGYWWDMVYPPHVQAPATDIMKVIEAKPADERLRVWVEGQTIEGKDVRKGVLLPLGPKAPARERLKKIGLTLVTLGADVTVGQVGFGSQSEKLGLEPGFKISTIELEAERPDKEWMFVPAFLLLGLIILLQRTRLVGVASGRAAKAG